MSTTELMSSIIKDKQSSIFIKKKDIDCLSEIFFNSRAAEISFDTLVKNRLCSVFTDTNNDDYCLIKDIDDICTIKISDQKKIIQKTLNNGNLKTIDFNLLLLIGSSTIIKNFNSGTNEPVDYPVIRNLIHFCRDEKLLRDKTEEKNKNFEKFSICTSRSDIVNFMELRLKRAQSIKQNKISIFANTAHYMGSKKNLGPFLVESISNFLPKDGIIIDLMCGSGAASQAYSNIWQTYASDVQYFSQYLASIQGSGYNTQKAKRLLKKLEPNIKENKDRLYQILSSQIEEEDLIFHSKITENLFETYLEFIEKTMCYPQPYHSKSILKIYEDVLDRKEDPTLFPYCLFTAYFANVYFGFRQSIEIDSIRYAIDKLRDIDDKKWSLGTLIATLSYLSSGYAAQFAQPVEPTYQKIPKLFEQRAKSVFHEFSVKLLAISKESENAKNIIQILPGPWEKTLSEAKKQIESRNVLVYLDAPYKREEYSRYYHVLETAVTYNYPSAILKGKLPDKKIGERFKSAFFSRTRENAETEFVKIINEILEHGWMCAWSYSDNGFVNIKSVIDKVHIETNCEVVSYPTPYQHKGQGTRKGKSVTEFCIIFSPKKQ